LLTRDDIGIHLTCELVVGGATWPCFSHTIEHPDGLVLVDTGMIESTPELDEHFHPTIHRLPDEVVERVAHVVITHMHFDHHGANRLFPGVPIHVQRIELEDARTKDEYTVREWIDFPGANYVEHDGEAEILPGIRIVPAPGETRGHQIVVVETDEDRSCSVATSATPSGRSGKPTRPARGSSSSSPRRRTSRTSASRTSRTRTSSR
jgi:N-acyl homoserine lactone hydrolase